MFSELSPYAVVAIITLIAVYYLLLTEKVHKTIAAILGGTVLIVLQVFNSSAGSSQEGAFKYVSNNLDVLGFIIGMMILVGIVKESGVFEVLAVWLVKKVRGQPKLLLVVIAYLTLLMTTFLSNIPTILILAPVILVLIKELKLPFLPYLFTVVTFANISGAMTPISDPTTYYQAKTVGLSFFEVLSNSGLIVMILSVVSLVYIFFVFAKDLKGINVSPEDVSRYEPKKAIKDLRILKFGLPILLVAIILMVTKDNIAKTFGVTLDNATITIGASFIAMLLFHHEPKKVFNTLVDWEIIFFFMGLFIVVGALEFTHVIDLVGKSLVAFTGGVVSQLTLIISVGSAMLSVFIDNVPYNITMVGAIKSMEASGIYVYPLWWALNLGTSIGGAGSPIAAACNVVVFGQAEQEKLHVTFIKYLKYAIPLVIINSLISFAVIWLRYLR